MMTAIFFHRIIASEGEMSAATGILFIDLIIRPFLKFGFKFYFVGFIILFLVYGFIAYKSVKSAYLTDNSYPY